MGNNILNKANYFLMVNKLLNTHLYRIKPDDRDSLTNRRTDISGTLLGQLFRDYYKS